MGQRLSDVRDSAAATLMGWASRLATRQYRAYLASCLNLGMAFSDPDYLAETGLQAPAYGEERLQCCTDEECCGTRGGWSTV
jgi:hypothetical protein